MEQLHQLFETFAEFIGLSVEPYRMYRPQGVNMEGYITFLHRTTDEFKTHQEAMWYYLQTVAQPLPHLVASPSISSS
jgi:hypothetical protein